MCVHQLAEQSDNVKARLVLALQEKRQLKKSISEGEKEVRVFVVPTSV